MQGERERERGGGLHSVFSAEELESSLAAEETQTRYVPYRLVQVGKVNPSYQTPSLADRHTT